MFNSCFKYTWRSEYFEIVHFINGWGGSYYDNTLYKFIKIYIYINKI